MWKLKIAKFGVHSQIISKLSCCCLASSVLNVFVYFAVKNNLFNVAIVTLIRLIVTIELETCEQSKETIVYYVYCVYIFIISFEWLDFQVL